MKLSFGRWCWMANDRGEGAPLLVENAIFAGASELQVYREAARAMHKL